MDNVNARLADLLNEAIASELSHRQLDAKISDVSLSKTTGVNVQSLRRYMEGTRAMPATAFVLLAHALGTDATTVVEAARARLAQ